LASASAWLRKLLVNTSRSWSSLIEESTAVMLGTSSVTLNCGCCISCAMTGRAPMTGALRPSVAASSAAFEMVSTMGSL
jgi:hypothetical protein